MEGELWSWLYRIVFEEHNRKAARQRVQFSDALILLVFFWAVLHDRPRCWACRLENWPKDWHGLVLPSPSTLSRRMRSLPVLLLLEQILARLSQLRQAGWLHVLDGKPLVVGPCTKDRDAKRARAHDVMANGYRLLASWGDGQRVLPEVWTLAPMNQDEAGLTQRELADRLPGSGYCLGDAMFDQNPLHQQLGQRGFQLLCPRKRPHTGLGHCWHSPFRLRSIALLEEKDHDFGRRLYALRPQIERDYGHLVSFGGGLSCLPAWVRTPHRVAAFVAAKLVINAFRLCQIKGLAA
jgi:hypothetical protein